MECQLSDNIEDVNKTAEESLTNQQRGHDRQSTQLCICGGVRQSQMSQTTVLSMSLIMQNICTNVQGH